MEQALCGVQMAPDIEEAMRRVMLYHCTERQRSADHLFDVLRRVRRQRDL
jgi:hypothetical protein